MAAMRVPHSVARWIFLCILLTSVLAKKCTKKCPSHRSPVCGSDGQTYKNQCKLENRSCYRPNLYLQSHGDCNLQGCRRTCVGPREQVCGTDGVTYDSLCHLDNAACTNAGISLRGHGRCQKEVILTSFNSDLEAKGVTRGPSEVIFEIAFNSSAGSQPIRGRNLWKLGIYGCRYIDGWCDKVNHIPQILSDDQAATPLGTDERTTIRNIRVMYDVSIIGCEDLPYICTEFSKGDDPRPDYVLTMPGQFFSAVSCFSLACDPLAVTEAPQWTPACRYECPESGHIVCGSDGVTYATECALDNEKRCSEDPNSYLLQRKHYGPCRTGVLIDNMFFSARGEEERDDRLSIETIIMSNSTGESISGRNLWKLGIYGSRFRDGSGPRLGYVPQLLDESQASTTFAAGKAIVLSASADFDVAAVGCSRYKFMCVEFTKGDSPQPPFPFTGNSGPEENSVFTACEQVPCNGQPEREIPDDGRKRVYVNGLQWGLKAGKRRSDGDYNVTVNLTAQLLGKGDYVSGNNLVRVGVFGSKNIYGEGEKFAFRRQILSRSQSSVALTPNSILEFRDIKTHFPVTGLGCSEYGYLCAELGKSDTTNQDFLWIPESLDITATDDSVLICKEIPCSNPDRSSHGGSTTGHNGGSTSHSGGSAGHESGTGGSNHGTGGHDSPSQQDLPFVAFAKIRWDSHPAPDGSGDKNLLVHLIPHPLSKPISGYRLWRVGIFGSNEIDGSGTRFEEIENALSNNDRRKPLVLGENLNFTIRTPSEMRNMGCRHPYQCIEFTKHRDSIPSFKLALGSKDAIVSCRTISCTSDTPGGHTPGGHTPGGHTPGGHTPGGHTPGGHTPGGHTPGGHSRGIVPGLPTARFYNISWSSTSGEVRAGHITDLNVHATLFPLPDTDVIAGKRLWRMGLYGNMYKDGTAPERLHYDEQILTPKQAKTRLRPNAALVFDVDTRFPLEGFGCDLHRYLCIEFAQHSHPDPQFNFPVENGAHVSCRPHFCEDQPYPEPEHIPNQNIARVSNFKWKLDNTSFNPNGLTDLRVFVNVTPSADTDTISGQNLWRVGVYGSRNQNGGEAYEARYDYNPQILQVHDARRVFAPNRPLRFDVNTKFDLRELGCGPYKYFCVEFGKDHLAAPDFSMPLSHGDVSVNCQRSLCLAGGSHTGGTDHSRPDPATMKMARITNVNWRLLGPTIYSNGDSDLRMLMDLIPHPTSDRINGGAGSGLWRVGIFANMNQKGTHPMKVNYERQILSQEDRDRSLIPPGHLNFDISTPFNLRRAHCASQYPFLCLEIAKGDTAYPDFNFPFPGGADSYISCQQSPCLETDTRVHSNVPVATVRSVTMDGATIQPGIVNDLFLDVSVNMADDSSIIRGANLWRVEMWGSKNSRGQGQQIGHNSQVLSETQTDRSYVPPEPLYFAAVPFTLDMRSKQCADVTHMCAKFSKQVTAVPEFSLQASPSSDVLTTCLPVDCSSPRNSQITVTGLSLFQMVGVSLRPGRPNTLTIGVRVSHDSAESVSFSGTNLWSLQMWMSSKANGKGKKTSLVNQALDNKLASVPFVVGRELQFRGIELSVNLLGKRCREARHVCARLSKNAGSSEPYELIASPSPNILTKCLPVNCS